MAASTAAAAKPDPAAVAAEEKKQAALREALKKLRETMKVPPEFSDKDLTRFLIARMDRKAGTYKVEETAKMLTAHIEWRAKNLPVKVTPEVEKALTCGKLIKYGRDRGGRPCIIIVGTKFDLNDKTEETKQAGVKACLAIIERAVWEMRDKPEWDGCVTIMYDRRDYSMAHSKVLLPWVKEVLAMCQNNYPERLHAAVIYPINWLYHVLWKVAQYFFDPVTAAKLTLLGEAKDYQKFVAPDNLFVEYTGTVKYQHTYNPADFECPTVITGHEKKADAAAAAAAATAAAPAAANATAAAGTAPQNQKQPESAAAAAPAVGSAAAPAPAAAATPAATSADTPNKA